MAGEGIIMVGLSSGMKITAGHQQKSIHIPRLAVHFTPRSVIVAEQEMHMCLQQLNDHHVQKYASHQNGYKPSQAKGRLVPRLPYLFSSGNGLTRGNTSLWCGYVLKWTVKTSLLCLCFGALFVGSMRYHIYIWTYWLWLHEIRVIA